eukprot:CAMPEP_0114419570 /NCGR_PEP_ID=MMETSP0103-20121206/4101_1 /TAXON_ID=37642 ORGANISM="Paraphysomonas imperforata, Strain PA2" /NCGR_SAMPLE_ID=MMETSP0103 /ASSEMBLY_ACC=CAM_ASM_000201 /LENGTH=558 /DNA_ID=CAMNT_0001588005 /DNA_START=201 /DNA_END=1878 /DNA_ORIENTATION=-
MEKSKKIQQPKVQQQPKENINLHQLQPSVTQQPTSMRQQEQHSVSPIQHLSHKKPMPQNEQQPVAQQQTPESQNEKPQMSPIQHVSQKQKLPASTQNQPPVTQNEEQPGPQQHLPESQNGQSQISNQQAGLVEEEPPSTKGPSGVENVQASVSELHESKMKAGRSKVMVPKPATSTEISSAVEIKKKIKKEMLKSKTQEQAFPLKPESSMGNFINNSEAITREKHIQNNSHNLKYDDESVEVNADRSTTHAFISNRVSDLYYSSDESDERSFRMTRRKNPHRTGSKEERLVDLSRQLFDDSAQPKAHKAKRWKERKRALVKTRGYGKESKKVILGGTEEKAYFAVNHHNSAHPPENSRPSSRSIKVKKMRNFRMAESKTSQSKSVPAEAKRPMQPSLRLKAESKRAYPLRGMRYSEDLPVKEESKDFLSRTLESTDDDRQAKEVEVKSSYDTFTQPHKPSTPKSSDSKWRNHHNTRSTSPRSRNNKHHTLNHFFYVNCYVDEERAEVLGARAAEEGITTPSELQEAISRDRSTPETLGMTPVDVMLTLKGLETIQSEF